MNLFVPSKFHGDSFMLEQTTGFPSNGTVSIALTRNESSVQGVEQQDLMLRIPSWCPAAAVSVTIKSPAGGVVRTLSGQPGSYLPLQLSDGQVAETDFQMELRVSLYNGTVPIDPFQCNAKGVVRAAVEYGPVLLAATYSQEPRCRLAARGGGPA